MLDLLTAKFLISYFGLPMRLFGSIGFVCIALGSVILLYLLGEKVMLGHALGDRPLLMLGMLMMVVGVQFLSLGILGELIIRVYHEGGRRSYLVRQPAVGDPVMVNGTAARGVQERITNSAVWPVSDAVPVPRGAHANGAGTHANGAGKQA